MLGNVEQHSGPVIEHHVNDPNVRSTDHSLVVHKSKLHTKMLPEFTLTVLQFTLAKWLLPNHVPSQFKIGALPRLLYA